MDNKREQLINAFNKKQVYSRITGEPVKFVDDIKDYYGVNGTYCDLLTLIEDTKKEKYEGEIKHAYTIFKTGKIINLQDFYEDYEAFDDINAFIKNVNTLLKDK